MKKKIQWLLRKAAALLMFTLAAAFVYVAFQATQNVQYAWLLVVVFAVLGVLLWRGKRKATPKAHAKRAESSKAQTTRPVAPPVPEKRPFTAPTVPKVSHDITPTECSVPDKTPPIPITPSVSMSSAPVYQFISFRVTGVTYENDDGTNRQELLRRIDERKPPFEDAGALDVHLKPTLWEGKDAIECRVNGYQIGFVPGNLVQDVLKAMKSKDAVISGFRLIGGGFKANGEALNYGVEMAVRYPAAPTASENQFTSFPIVSAFQTSTASTASHTMAKSRKQKKTYRRKRRNRLHNKERRQVS